jgi:hypothetical protein
MYEQKGLVLICRDLYGYAVDHITNQVSGTMLLTRFSGHLLITLKPQGASFTSFISPTVARSERAWLGNELKLLSWWDEFQLD